MGIAGVEGDRRLVAQLLDAQPGDFAAPAAARAEGDQQQRAVAAIGEPVGTAGGEQPVEDVAGDGALTLAPARPRAGAHGEPHRGAQRRGGERAVEPAPAMQRAPTGEPALDRRGRVRAVDAQGAGGGQRGGDLGRHAVGGVDLALGGIPQVMGDEFQRQALGRRPEEGRARRRLRPGFEIGQVGGERAQRIFAHPFAREVFERGDVVVGENLGEPVAPIDRQDGGEGVELQRPAGFGIGERRSRRNRRG